MQGLVRKKDIWVVLILQEWIFRVGVDEEGAILEWLEIKGDEDDGDDQSQKNPVSASAMLTGKFLQIRKVFVTCSLLAEEFPDNLENVWMLHKISR